MTRAPHLCVAAGVLSLAAAALVLVPGPADATVLSTPAVNADVIFDKDPASGVTCTLTSPGSSDAGVFAADGVPVTHSTASNATLTDDANPADKTIMSGSLSATATATQTDGQLDHVRLTSTASASLTTTSTATRCGGNVDTSPGIEYAFDLARPTLVTVTTRAHRMLGEVVVGQLSSAPLAALIFVIGNNHPASQAVLLPAGTSYVATTEIGLGLNAPATATTVTSSGDLTVDFEFTQPGASTTAQFGAGGKYVTLPATRDCSTGAVDATWSKRAGKGRTRAIKKATVLVDGVRVASIKKPKRKQTTPIAADPHATIQVELVFQVKKKGELLVQRAYRPCS